MMTFPRSRSLLIWFTFALASVQVVGTDSFINTDYVNSHLYAEGRAKMPFQGRVLMMPFLHWASNTSPIQKASTRYGDMLSADSPLLERETPEKFVSMLAGICALLLMVCAASWYGRRFGKEWWLAPALTLLIVGVTVDLRVEHNVWYAYDLPHAALFGLAVVAAVQRRWVLTLLLFCIDVPMRETSLFLLPIVLPLFWLNGDSGRAFLLERRNLRAILSSSRARLAGIVAMVMAVYWTTLEYLIRRRFAANVRETGWQLSHNVHEFVRPHHWSQTFTAGGYLAVFIWLQRRSLPLAERLVLWGSLLCVPVVLWFSLWTETRVWLEWSVPLAITGAWELLVTLRINPPARIA